MSQVETSEHSYNNQYLDIFGCNHSQRLQYSQKSICQQCGLFVNNPNTRVYKTLKMKYSAFFDPLRVLSLIMNGTKIQQHQKDRVPIIDFIEQASERLNLSPSTSFLAISYLDHYFCKVEVSDDQVFLYSAAALMLAAKAQELDERIPFISKLKRYCSMTQHPEINNFSTQDLRTAERNLIQSLEWKLQRVTLLDRIEAILSFGVIDDDDTLVQQPQQKENKEDQAQQQPIHVKFRDLNETQILPYVKEIEGKYIEIAFQIIRDDSIYFQNDHSILALSCIAYLRKKAGLLNIWSQQLQALSGESTQKISSTVSQIMTLVPRKLLNTKTLIQTQSSTYLNYQTNPLISAQSMKVYKNKHYLFEGNNGSTGDILHSFNTSKAHVKVPLFQSQSTLSLSRNDQIKPTQLNVSKFTGRTTNFTTTTNYSYLTDNIVHPNSYIKQYSHHNQELDKKYEQVHKVSDSKFRTKIFN